MPSLWEQSQCEDGPGFPNPDLLHWISLCERNLYSGVENYEVLTCPPAPGRPTPSTNSVCLEAARQSVAHHLQTIPRFISDHGNRSTYFTWVLLYGSFTPFFVISINVISSLHHEVSVYIISAMFSTSP